MKFTKPDGNPIKIEGEGNGKEVEQPQHPANPVAESPTTSMTFKGDTTQIDLRKGKPANIHESIVAQQAIEKKKHHGWLFRTWVILWSLFLLLVLFVLALIRAIKTKAAPYLAEKELPIPEIAINQESIANSKALIGQLQGKLPLPTDTKDLVITKDDINQFMANYQIEHSIPGKMFVTFPSDNNVLLYGSVPLWAFSMSLFNNKRFNAIVQFSWTYHDTIVDAEIVKILLGDQDVTELYKNLFGTLRISQPDDVGTRTQLDRFDSITSSKNKIHFMLK